MDLQLATASGQKPKGNEVVPHTFKIPAQVPVKFKKVLSEDAFSESIDKIIERDFFPDIHKLESQAEYFHALEKNDLVKIREIQMRMKRPDTCGSDIAASPATFETPQSKGKKTPAKESDGANNRPQPADPLDDDFEFSSKKDTPKMKLDAFLARNTSEDSASFVEILKESDRKHRLKHSWVYEKEEEQLSEHKEFIALPSIEQQAAIEDKPLHINTWKYVNRNAVMYVPEGEELSAKELIEAQKHKPKKIVHENTRFHTNPFGNAKSKEAMQKAATFKALSNSGKIGHDGREIGAHSPHVNGFGFVGTPSPAPGVADSPMMTWGEVEGTPARLDASNDALPSSTPGPKFRIPDVPKRERLALALSEKASKAHRDKKEEALRQVTRRFASPSPSSSKISLSSSERLSSMSPAAQRLASKRLGIRTSTDRALQASYSPSPSPTHRLAGGKTPVRLTPSSKRSSGGSSRRSGTLDSPAVHTPSSQRGDATPSSSDKDQDAPSLTDHLLNLPKRKRKSAADFF